jgi:hypothetical protein
VRGHDPLRGCSQHTCTNHCRLKKTDKLCVKRHARTSVSAPILFNAALPAETPFWLTLLNEFDCGTADGIYVEPANRGSDTLLTSSLDCCTKVDFLNCFVKGGDKFAGGQPVPLGLALSEKQIPRIAENAEKSKWSMELLESDSARPRRWNLWKPWSEWNRWNC